MESGDKFNYAVRIKLEPEDEIPTENDHKIFDETVDTENFQCLRFLTENPVQMLQKYDENHENELDDLQIDFECKDMKQNVDLLVVKKTEDHSQNYLQNSIYSDDNQTQNTIKLETVQMVKKEISGNEATKLNFDYELREKNKNKGVTEELNDTYSTCGKKFKKKKYLRVHVDSVHRGINYACNLCGKSFKKKINLKIHVDSVHKGILYTCNICEKTFTKKFCLKLHIDSVHRKITYACDKCDKSFSQKSHLTVHTNSIHDGVTYMCDTCGKIFTQKNNLQNHINSVHKGIKHSCDVCGKKCSTKTFLNAHINKLHKRINGFDTYGQRFIRQSDVKTHIDTVDNTHICDSCGKKFGQKRSLRAHIAMAHRSS